MKKGLKIIALLFVCVFMVTVTGCGKSDKSKKDSSKSAQENVLPKTFEGKSFKGAFLGRNGKMGYMIIEFTDDSNWKSQGYTNQEYKDKSNELTTVGKYSISDDTLNIIMTELNVTIEGKIVTAGDAISVTFDEEQAFPGSLISF